MLSLFKCTHPANRLGVERKETVEPMHDDFNLVTYHLVCIKCDKQISLNYADPIGGSAGFLASRQKDTP
jgi:hypothetical protein